MLGIVKKIKNAYSKSKTYRAGLYQAKAYRILKYKTSELLSVYDISTIAWALLGILNDNPKGLRPSIISKNLGVEAPFVTVIARKLFDKNLLQYAKDPEDSRAKLIQISGEGKLFVVKIEKYLSANMKPLLKGVTPSELINYLSVIHKIVENGEAIMSEDSSSLGIKSYGIGEKYASGDVSNRDYTK